MRLGTGRRKGIGLAGVAVLVLAALAVIWQTWPGGSAADDPRRLTVFAAASLTDVLPEIDPDARYSFGGSNSLSVQIENGAPADVFASASPKLTERLHEQGLVEEPSSFAGNSLVLIVPRSNPAGIRSVRDLAEPGVAVDVAGPDVPVGEYTLRVLENLGLSRQILPNVVSRETDVRAVLSKVALGQADAGFVYATDAKQSPEDVTVIELPRSAQPPARYSVAVVADSPNRDAARVFARGLREAEAQAKLVARGFLPCHGCPGAKP